MTAKPLSDLTFTTRQTERQLVTAVWRNGGSSASYDSFVVGSSAVLRLNFVLKIRHYAKPQNVSTNFMRTRITSYLLLFLTSNLAVGQTNYEKEVKQFLADILLDTYTYNLKNYQHDSIKLSKTDAFDFEYAYLKSRIDTSNSKYMLRSSNGKMHFDTLLIVKEPADFYYDNEKKELLKFLSRDSIFEISNPFKGQTKDKSIKTYIKNKNVQFDNLIKADFVTQKEISLTLKKGEGWPEFYKKYGDGFLKMTNPIFTSDYEYAYFNWSYHCGGLCGYGYSGLYKMRNGKWTPLKIYMAWMS